MQAGFARVNISPPSGTPLLGVGETTNRISVSINDPIHVRSLSLRHEDHEVLIMAFDLCFLGREDSDRFKGVLGRETGLLPSQILLAASHTHAAPALGCYYDMEYAPPLRDYLRDLERAVVCAAKESRNNQREVRLRAGMAKTKLPLNRRQLRDGKIVNAPNPKGPTLDSLPMCLFEDSQGKPVAFLFSISTHPVCMRGLEVSADYPGMAMEALDSHLGATCSIFLQGTGGDSRPRPLGDGKMDWNFDSGADDARAIGRILADEVKDGLRALKPVEPKIRSAIIETQWPFQNVKRQDYEAILRRAGYQATPDKPDTGSSLEKMHHRWAGRQLRLLDQGNMPKSLSILLQGIQIAEGVRLVALEGEPMAEQGKAMEEFFGNDTLTFALGYANGEGIYLATSQMLDEGGYEAESYWEYGHPAPLAKGAEKTLVNGLQNLNFGT